MTNYYVKFDEDGIQSEIRYGLDEENPSGWYDTGTEDMTNKFFKLSNGNAVAIPEEEKNNLYKSLSNKSGVFKARVQRNLLLASCDWTQVSDVALSNEEKQAWADYRQALRDLPSTVDENGNFTFPTPPDPNFNPLA